MAQLESRLRKFTHCNSSQIGSTTTNRSGILRRNQMNPRFFSLVLFGLALFLCTRVATAQQTTTLTVQKTQDWKQTDTNGPVPVINPYSLSLFVNAQGYTISSATVTTPAQDVIPLISNSSTVFTFTSTPLATTSDTDTTYPNGSYLFTVTPIGGSSFSDTVVLAAGSYPAVSLNNSQWTAGALQFDPTLDFDLSWTVSNAVNDISLTIADPNGAVVYTTTVPSNSVFQTIPANTLQQDVKYSGRLTFGVTQTSRSRTATLHATYASVINFTLNPVIDLPKLINPTAFTAVVGQPISYQLIPNSNATLEIDNGLPAGLNFDATTGIIYGTPTASGDQQPQYGVSNAGGANGGILDVNAQSPPAGPSFTNSTSVTGHVGAGFAFQLVTTGASSAATFSATGLPDGITINGTTGIISGRPTTPGSSAVSITVADGRFSRTSTLQLSFLADPILPIITSPRRVRIYPGQQVSYKVTAAFGSNRADTPDFRVLGTLPSGLTFDPKTGMISGTFGGQLERSPGPPGEDFLNDSPLVQLAATNTHGTGTSPLVFLTAPTGTVNLSTRMFVGSGNEVLIGGFIITGNASENILLRAIGPSLPISSALQDPVLELHLGDGTLKTTNDNWKDNQEATIRGTGVPPTDNRESALVAAFEPSNFTAIVRGKNNTTGTGLVELFDLGTNSHDTSQHAQLVQISTRGTVHTGDDVMIGGFIIQSTATKTLLRGIGPELSAQGVPGALQDPTLELHNGNGAVIRSNDNWRSTQEQEIMNTTVPPKDDRESAIVATLNPGNYTAVLRGKNNTTGVALVEIYALQ
jgi:hypothetical protein